MKNKIYKIVIRTASAALFVSTASFYFWHRLQYPDMTDIRYIIEFRELVFYSIVCYISAVYLWITPGASKKDQDTPEEKHFRDWLKNGK